MNRHLSTRVGIPILSSTCFINTVYFRPGAQNIAFKKCLFLSSASSSQKLPSFTSPRSLSESTVRSQRLLTSTLISLRRASSSTSGISSVDATGMDLKEVVCELNRLAPTWLAESWDNVGLLVEPTPPHRVQTMFLTNDLTEEVLAEAVDKGADLVLAYHPPIFTPLKRLTMASAKERILVRAIEKRIAIYSPHTCYDAVAGGVNDWLAEGLEPCKVQPLKTSYKNTETGWTHRLEYQESDEYTVSLPADLEACVSAVTKIPTSCGFQCTVNCNERGLVSIMKAVEQLPEIKKTVQITKLEKLPMPATGTGRLCILDTALSLSTIVQRVKDHLGLQHVQLALGSKRSQESVVQSVAICAGSGASVLSGVPAAVYLTGEMSHHDILAAVARGTSVILCNHSNTERGYLRVLRAKLERLFNGKISVAVSEVDADPLNVI